MDSDTRYHPSHHSGKLQWAEQWVHSNGMTLPPDTPKLRPLRNWFCFKINQGKKGLMKQSEIDLLKARGIDLLAYQTGYTSSSSALTLAAAIAQWHHETGSFDLNVQAPRDLVRQQRLLLGTFSQRGYTSRAEQIESLLPGFRIPLWRGPGQPPASADLRQWLESADQYRAASQNAPAYLGGINPSLDSAFKDWAHEQIACADRLSPTQRGLLYGEGVLVNRIHRLVDQRREVERKVKQGISLDSGAHGLRDRRLSSFLGICMYFRMLTVQSDDREIMSAFGITPATLEILRENINLLNAPFSRSAISSVRPLFRKLGEDVFQLLHPRKSRIPLHRRWPKPTELQIEIIATVQRALSFTRANPLEQDIPLY